MIVTIEISHYPLENTYEKQIIDLIKKLKTYEHITVFTHAMSTYVQGDLLYAMNAIGESLTFISADNVVSSTVLKIVNRPLAVKDGFLDF